jgi:hypothetical protein
MDPAVLADRFRSWLVAAMRGDADTA